MVKERSAPSTPTERMINALKGLCEDKRNTVFVVSGKERHSLTTSLQGIPNLGLAAEHGMFISWPTKNTTKRRWETLVPETDRSWRSLAVNIMEVYTSRTQGSYIEQTEMKVLWQYRDADTEFGSLQAKELEDHLSKYLRSFPVDILHGGIEEGGYVEVRPKGVNKGVLAMRVLKRFPEIAQYARVNFALVLGDDHCDEPMLSVMRQIGRRVMSARLAAQGADPLPDMPATIQLVDVSSCDNYVSPDLDVFTCTIGKKPSAAANYLHDVEEVQELLDSLVKLSARELRHFSSADLRSFSHSETSSSSFGLHPPPAFTQSERPGIGYFPASDHENTTWLGLPKSMSFGMLNQAAAAEPLSEHAEHPATVSTTLNEFMETIDYEGEEDIFF
jgi:trehalose 6-phosphate synthase/phosphatase